MIDGHKSETPAVLVRAVGVRERHEKKYNESACAV
jgi:hypothetical protein